MKQKLKTFFDNFGLLAETHNSIPKLRELILQLAVQGKLVPQDPNDEPAAVLLEKIKAEKERLIAEKKIKKPKPLPPIEPEEVPYELPKRWEWERLANLGFTQTGTTPSKSKSEYFGNDYPFVKPGDIFINCINYDNEGLSVLGMKNARLIKAGSAFMVCIGGSIGKVGLVERDCSCNQQINAINPYLGLDNKLFVSFMRSTYFQNEILSNASQTTLPILNKGKWDLILFPLPPLAEQKRIVAKVDALMALCDELESQSKSSWRIGGSSITRPWPSSPQPANPPSSNAIGSESATTSTCSTIPPKPSPASAKPSSNLPSRVNSSPKKVMEVLA